MDSAPGIAAALNALRERRGLSAIGTALVRPWISLGAAELVRLGLGPAACHLQDDLSEFRGVLRTLPTPTGALYPGVASCLRALVNAGMALAIVTNKPEALARQLLADVGLLDAFVAVIGGDTVRYAKPHAEPLLAALRAVAVSPEQAIFVGDSVVDADAAAALLMPFFLYQRGYGAAECADRPVSHRFTHHRHLRDILLKRAQVQAC